MNGRREPGTPEGKRSVERKNEEDGDVVNVRTCIHG